MPGLELHWDDNDKVIELGGGDQPTIRPNVDVRAGENVDIVADFNEPLPFSDEEYDGIYSKFCIEHISHLRIRAFISECYRILKPGGKAIFITANLYEQCKKVVEAGDDGLNDDLVCMIFGGQGYLEDTHRCGFSPQFACKLFAEAGFSKVDVYELPGCVTDMIVEATK